jgi:hypothetical protein
VQEFSITTGFVILYVRKIMFNSYGFVLISNSVLKKAALLQNVDISYIKKILHI